MANWLLISALGLLLAFPADFHDQPECEPLSVEVRSAGGTVIVNFSAATRKEDLVLHLFTNGGDQNKLNLKAENIDGLTPGKYVLVIVDSRSVYCPRKIDVEITR